MSGTAVGTGSVSGTPDYAVGLTALNPPTPTPASAAATPSYIPSATATASVVTISGMYVAKYFLTMFILVLR